MKQKLLAASLMSAFAISSLTASAWNVTTQPTNKSALIEEFTGIQCPNCPQGHAVAATLMNLHPGEVFAVAIHAGYFAQSVGTQPDFVTPLGTAIHDHFGVSSYPSAVVNRGEIAGRGDWGSVTRGEVAAKSPVNLWTGVGYDEATRTVTLDVEGYLVEDMRDPRLNVFLLQSEIPGPQLGGQLGNEYPHRHMLRGRLTDNDFGDAVAEKKSGEYFSRKITYVLPAGIGDVEVDPRNVELLTFVTDGADNVCKAVSDRLSVHGMEPLFNVSATAPLIPIGKNYAFDFVEMWIDNHGGVPVTSADFDITLNNVKKSCRWEGEVPAHTSSLVRIPLNGEWDSFVDSENNSYIIRMVRANGTDVETASLRGKYNEIGRLPAELTFVIRTDLDAADNTWRILDSKGYVVKEFGPYENGKVAEYTESVSLEDGGIYCLEVTDCWGDGVCHPNGSLRITDAGGKQVAQYKEIKNYGLRQFFRADAAAGVGNVMAAEPVAVEYYDLSGRRIPAPCEGVSIVRTRLSDGTVKYEKQMNH